MRVPTGQRGGVGDEDRDELQASRDTYSGRLMGADPATGAVYNLYNTRAAQRRQGPAGASAQGPRASNRPEVGAGANLAFLGANLTRGSMRCSHAGSLQPSSADRVDQLPTLQPDTMKVSTYPSVAMRVIAEGSDMITYPCPAGPAEVPATTLGKTPVGRRGGRGGGCRWGRTGTPSVGVGKVRKNAPWPPPPFTHARP